MRAQRTDYIHLLVLQYIVASLLSYSITMAGRLQVMHLTLHLYVGETKLLKECYKCC